MFSLLSKRRGILHLAKTEREKETYERIKGDVWLLELQKEYEYHADGVGVEVVFDKAKEMLEERDSKRRRVLPVVHK